MVNEIIALITTIMTIFTAIEIITSEVVNGEDDEIVKQRDMLLFLPP